MWLIACRTLVADRGKLLIALVGIVFSVVLVNVQGGLFFGLIRKASLLVDRSDAHVWVGHRAIHNADFPEDIPRRWIHRIRGIPSVEAVEPFVVGHSKITLPEGGFEMIVLVAAEANASIQNAWNFAVSDRSLLRQTDGVMVDRCDDDKLVQPRVGQVREIGGRRARVVALSDGILGFLVTPYVFTTLDRAASFLGKSNDVCSYFLVKTHEDADVATVCQQIRQRLPHVDVLTKEEYSRMSVNYWMRRTGLGISFGASTLLGLLVGAVVVGQTLYTSVLDRIHEYGTLLALGAKQSQINSVLVFQALIMAIVGSVVGMACVSMIQATLSTPRAPIVVPWWLSLGSCLVVTAICLLCSLLPIQKIRHIDPASVLQS